ncbi:MAG: radical SAM protein [Pseudomonadota bacterium]
MKHVFGPVRSHRLGMSLGLDLVSPKTCNFNCIYCELGPTRRRTARRAVYVPAEDVLAEVDLVLGRNDRPDVRPDVLTLCGSGEPTLNSQIGALIAALKGRGVPVALLTNGSLLASEAVREDVQGVDILLPSLDAADDATFAQVNRPLRAFSSVAAHVAGLKAMRRRFKGRIWLEVMLVAGFNDSAPHLEALAALCRQTAPDRVQLTTVLRPPAGGTGVRPLATVAMNEARQIFEGRVGCPVDIPAETPATNRKEPARSPGLEEELLAMLSRRPSTAEGAAEALRAENSLVAELLDRLHREGTITLARHGGQTFYTKR